MNNYKRHHLQNYSIPQHSNLSSCGHGIGVASSKVGGHDHRVYSTLAVTDSVYRV